MTRSVDIQKYSLFLLIRFLLFSPKCCYTDSRFYSYTFAANSKFFHAEPFFFLPDVVAAWTRSSLMSIVLLPVQQQDTWVRMLDAANVTKHHSLLK